MKPDKPAVWFPAVRTHTGTDVFTQRLVTDLKAAGLRAEITWLPARAEFAPWSVRPPSAPPWANIVHVNSWLHSKFWPIGLPCVVTAHLCVHDPALAAYKSLPQSLYHRFWVRPIERRAFSQARKLIAVSAYTARMVNQVFGCEAEVVHHGLTPANRAGLAPRQRPHRPFRILYVGSWSRRKGVELLGPIMRQLGAGFELWIVSAQRKRPDRDALPINSRWLGARQTKAEMETVYQAVDALIFPTRLEGFGLVALEAQASGLPVVASDNSSLPEVVLHDETGFLCETNRAEAFAARLQQLAAPGSVWPELSKQAIEHARLRFSTARMVQAHRRIYQQVLGPMVASQDAASGLQSRQSG